MHSETARDRAPIVDGTDVRPIRILIAKPGMDSHWRGAVMVARALRDAGMEVIYLGNQTPEAIVRAAIEEDVDVVGLSCMSGSHMLFARSVTELLGTSAPDPIPVIIGGIIPDDDVPRLREAGVAAVFRPGDPLATIVEAVRGLVRKA